MRFAGLALGALVAVAAALALLLAFTSETSAPEAPTATASPADPDETATPLPATWMDALAGSAGGTAMLLSCLDANGDTRLTDADTGVPAGVTIDLAADGACVASDAHADYYAEPPPTDADCARNASQVLIVAIASAGSDLRMPREGESLGLLPIVNGIAGHTRDAGYSTRTIIAVSAIFGAAEQPQTSMERWIAADVAERLRAAPCLRAVLIGHSHGGVTVTSASAMLDAEFAGRVFAVLIDRSAALYDRPADDWPLAIAVLNLFQLNEGWHGEPRDAPNVTNIDRSQDRAPVALSDGGGPPAVVTHKTLDDSPDVQRIVVEAVIEWLAR
jgi:pimeloyl-ACP methyl ester carboxylesterase